MNNIRKQDWIVEKRTQLFKLKFKVKTTLLSFQFGLIEQTSNLDGNKKKYFKKMYRNVFNTMLAILCRPSPLGNLNEILGS